MRAAGALYNELIREIEIVAECLSIYLEKIREILSTAGKEKYLSFLYSIRKLKTVSGSDAVCFDHRRRVFKTRLLGHKR